MKLYKHRTNTLNEIKKSSLNPKYGFECDIRYHNGEPYLNHELDKSNQKRTYLKDLISYTNGIDVILNFKETGHELFTYEKYKNKFKTILMLDIPFPEFVKAKEKGIGDSLMWRVSEYEKPKIDTINHFNSKWIWLDSFSKYWFDINELKEYKQAGLNICLVSNELQSRPINKDKDLIIKLLHNKLIDAICTKDIIFYSNMD